MSCFLGNYRNEEEEEEEGTFCKCVLSIDEYVLEETEEVETPKEKSAEHSHTVESPLPSTDCKSVVSHHDSVNESDIAPLTEAEVIKIIEDLMKGDYDANIIPLWKTVETTHYSLEDASVRLHITDSF